MPALRQLILPAALASYLALLPLAGHAALSAHDLARLCQLVLFALAAILLSANPLQITLSKRAILAIAVVAALAVASCAAADVPSVALQELALDLGLVGLALAWMQHCSISGLGIIWRIPILASAIYVGLQLIVYGATLANGHRPSSWLLSFGYDNPRFLNHTQTLAIPFLVTVSRSSFLPAAWRRLAMFGVVGHMLMLTATLGRGTMLALLASGMFAALAYGKPGRAYAGRLMLAAIAGVAAHAALFVLLPESMNLGSATSSSLVAEAAGDHSRIKLWQIALGDIAQHPWLGIGPMHFAHYQNPTAAHPHNVYLQFAAEAGLPAFFLLIGGVLIGLRRAHRKLKALPAGPTFELALTAYVACIAALLDGFVSGNFVMPMSQIWIVFAAGALAGALRSGDATPPAVKGSVSLSRIFAIVLLASTLWLALIATRQVANSPPRIGSYSASQLQDEKHRPRFWLDGWF